MSNINDLKKYSEKRTGVDLIKMASTKEPISHISTGVFLLDFGLLGGIPENRVTTIIGRKHSGKTTISYKIISNFQKKYDGTKFPKKFAACIDLEQAFDPIWAQKNGVNLDELILIQPFDGESAVDLTCAALENGDIGLVIFDSIPNLVPGKEIDKSAEDMVIAPVATLAQRMLRKVSTIIAKSASVGEKKTLVLINQWREKAGVSFGDPRSKPGGKFVEYYSSVEFEIYNRKQETSKDEDDIDSYEYNEHSFSISKNRIGNCIKEGEFIMNRRNTSKTYTDADGEVHETFFPESTISDRETVVKYAQKFGMVEGAGPKWTLTRPSTGEVIQTKGKQPIIDMVHYDDELYEELKKEIISKQRRKIGLSEIY